MKLGFLNYLVCALCHAELELEVKEQNPDGEIISGSLKCKDCGHIYRVRGGVPRMIPGRLENDKENTAAAFGWQWQKFTEMHEEYREQFLDWIKPLQPEFFQGKVVLDAGCGIGRHAYWS